ncbi:putative duf167 domain protein [Golovinomyces cichoracearum]|uniref:Putative duf167 domain protein n=1 Tax=Golovinomyces cichoracearum TaxID=62708 RepID=A0A420IUD4_9PEZI|nr:putative duf167 domain protein [Golovinomyces cichoracearum]
MSQVELALTCQNFSVNAVRMSSQTAFRYIAVSNKSDVGCILIECLIKPGVSAKMQGIIAIMSHHVIIGTSAQPRDGKANYALRHILSRTLKWPKTDVEITRGCKSRIKTIAIKGLDIAGREREYISKFKEKLEHASKLKFTSEC